MVSNFFIFTPTWGNDPIRRAYFSNGLKPPTRESCEHDVEGRLDLRSPAKIQYIILLVVVGLHPTYRLISCSCVLLFHIIYYAELRREGVTKGALSATPKKTRWRFETFSFNPYFGKIPFWLIFFNRVETTNQKTSGLLSMQSDALSLQISCLNAAMSIDSLPWSRWLRLNFWHVDDLFGVFSPWHVIVPFLYECRLYQFSRHSTLHFVIRLEAGNLENTTNSRPFADGNQLVVVFFFICSSHTCHFGCMSCVVLFSLFP